MRPNGGKSKGKGFESKIADYLHKVFYSDCQPYKELFDSVGNEDVRPQRDASSGNYARSDGDIDLGILKKFFPFSIECKHRKDLDLSLNYLFKTDNSKLEKIFIDQAVVNAERKDLKPIVIFRANRTKDFVYVEKKYLSFEPSTYLVLGDRIIMLLEDFIFGWIKNNC